jgi:hypothetical protein
LRFHYRPRGRDDVHTMSQPSRFLSEQVVSCFDTVSRSRYDARPSVTIDAGVRVELELDALWN